MTLSEIGIKEIKNGLYSTLCPQCSHLRKREHQKMPCLTVNNVEGNVWWNCNHCNFKGKLNTYEKYEKVRKASGMPMVLPDLFSKEVSDLLTKKQITPQTAKAYGCYERKGFNGHYELAFPYFKHHTLVNVMYRRTVYNKETEGKVYQLGKDKHGAESCYWGLQLLDLNASKTVTIVEGQFDALTHFQCGYTNVLSVPMGAPSPEQKNLENKMAFAKDPYVMEILSQAERINLFTDGDANGVHLRNLLADIYGKDRCWIYDFPKGYKDSNEIYAGDIEKGLDPLSKVGIDKMHELSIPFPIRGIITIDNCREELLNMEKNGVDMGYFTGKSYFDDLFRVKKKILLGITAIPGAGKSLLWREYMINLCKNNKDLKIAGFTPEMRPPSREYIKIMENYIGKTYRNERTNSMSTVEKSAAEDFVRRHFTLVAPDTNNFENLVGKVDKAAASSPKGLRSILAYMKYLKHTYGIQGFWIDAWNKLDHQRPSNKPIEEFISHELDYVLEFLDREDLFCAVIAHPTKMDTVRGGNYRKPTLYDIKGSSAWNEKLDIGIVAHRNLYRNMNRKDDNGDEVWEIDNTAPTVISVEKMKFDELGELGSVKLWLDKERGDRFTPKDPAQASYQDKINSKKVVPITSSVPESSDDEYVEPPF
jgi:twinkle protein